MESPLSPPSIFPLPGPCHVAASPRGPGFSHFPTAPATRHSAFVTLLFLRKPLRHRARKLLEASGDALPPRESPESLASRSGVNTESGSWSLFPERSPLLQPGCLPQFLQDLTCALASLLPPPDEETPQLSCSAPSPQCPAGPGFGGAQSVLAG